ncbi:hypothetical protein JTF12_20450 [Leclercia adecarboxylata]|uniref:hypothetical protein n=1 Tax=Leclercia adecarboxylata TaxID=83655 RepID=UPI00194F248F|nr:hypothetical protein [Leclercia adecarboxylata]MBM6636706.1 hypothetical protein [Leclercia adecarboxylata]
MAFDEMSDLTEKRLTKSDVLEKLKDQIILLSGSKGYSVEDILSALDGLGIQTSIKTIRETLNAQKKQTAGTGVSRCRTTKNPGQTSATEDK